MRTLTRAAPAAMGVTGWQGDLAQTSHKKQRQLKCDSGARSTWPKAAARLPCLLPPFLHSSLMLPGPPGHPAAGSGSSSPRFAARRAAMRSAAACAAAAAAAAASLQRGARGGQSAEPGLEESDYHASRGGSWGVTVSHNESREKATGPGQGRRTAAWPAPQPLLPPPEPPGSLPVPCGGEGSGAHEITWCMQHSIGRGRAAATRRYPHKCTTGRVP
jgi:hypothetical protein